MIDTLTFLAGVLYAEARGEGLEGRLLVLGTMVERAGNYDAEDMRWVASIPAHYAEPDFPDTAKPIEVRAWQECVALVRGVCAGKIVPPSVQFSDGSFGRPNHFYNPDQCEETPAWAIGQPWHDSGNHRFVRVGKEHVE